MEFVLFVILVLVLDVIRLRQHSSKMKKTQKAFNNEMSSLLRKVNETQRLRQELSLVMKELNAKSEENHLLKQELSHSLEVIKKLKGQ